MLSFFSKNSKKVLLYTSFTSRLMLSKLFCSRYIFPDRNSRWRRRSGGSYLRWSIGKQVQSFRQRWESRCKLSRQISRVRVFARFLHRPIYSQPVEMKRRIEQPSMAHNEIKLIPWRTPARIPWDRRSTRIQSWSGSIKGDLCTSRFISYLNVSNEVESRHCIGLWWWGRLEGSSFSVCYQIFIYPAKHKFGFVYVLPI